MSESMSKSNPSPAKVMILGITACPTGIAHTYMAAEKLDAAAAELGYVIKVETHGSVGVENAFSQAEIDSADAIVIAADTAIDLSRFAGKRLVSARVGDGIHRPHELIAEALAAPRTASAGDRHEFEGSVGAPGAGVRGKADLGGTLYRSLMNGVSHMIPFVVVGGLLIAISLSFGGEASAAGLVIPADSFWFQINAIGAIGFSLMVPILSGYIAVAIADRPGLAPGMIVGWIATTGSFYNSDSGAGFIGGIIAGFLVGFVALGIKKIPVHQFIKPIMPILVIPILTTIIVGGAFILVLGQPIAWVFASLTSFLNGLDGGSVLLLGVLLGAMVAFDMGGPVNKTAFLFGSALIAAGNPAPMGMVAAAIAVPPLGMGIATLLRRRYFSKPEQEAGIAALFMGFFGITEGAIPLAAAKPLQVIPANIIGGAVAGGIAALAGVTDSVPHGGPIVAVFGAVSGVPMYFAAIVGGVLVTAAASLLLLGISARRGETGGPTATATTADATAVSTPSASKASIATATTTATSVLNYIDERTIVLDTVESDRDAMIRSLVGMMASTGNVRDPERVAQAAFAREEIGTTGIGEGIAIPHAKTDAVTSPVVAFARSRDGIDWKSVDGTKATLIFMIAVPEAAAGNEHLKVLAELSRALMKPVFRHAIQSAITPADVLAALNDSVGPGRSATPA